MLHGSYDLPGARLLDLVEVMDRLRRECPWDREQTHQSLLHYLVEEAYETLEAIETGDTDHLREELGDLLLQVMFHARIAAEHPRRGGFTIDDVAAGIVDKLVQRHPHVFADTTSPAPRRSRPTGRRSRPPRSPSIVLEGVPIGVAGAQPRRQGGGQGRQGRGHPRRSPGPIARRPTAALVVEARPPRSLTPTGRRGRGHLADAVRAAEPLAAATRPAASWRGCGTVDHRRPGRCGHNPALQLRGDRPSRGEPSPPLAPLVEAVREVRPHPTRSHRGRDRSRRRPRDPRLPWQPHRRGRGRPRRRHHRPRRRPLRRVDTAQFEAVELRDGGERYGWQGRRQGRRRRRT